MLSLGSFYKTILILSVFTLAACGGGGGGSAGGGEGGGGGTIDNLAPTITSGNFQVDQDTDLEVTLTATDPEGDSVTFAQAGSPENGSVTVFDSNGSFTYTPNAGFTGSDSFTVTASDGTNEVSATITFNVIEVIPPNAAPVFTSAATVNIDENSSGVVYIATASDADGDALIFNLSGGTDQAAFTLDSSNGE
jgi:hypothetical protein